MNWCRGHHELASPWFLVGGAPPPWIELQPMCRKAQFMPKAIHESLTFNSCNRKVAIHCVFPLWANTHPISKNRGDLMEKFSFGRTSLYFVLQSAQTEIANQNIIKFHCFWEYCAERNRTVKRRYEAKAHISFWFAVIRKYPYFKK